MSNKRLRRVCFTGHRPDKIDLNEKQAKELLEKAIDYAISQGFITFITGMAMGVDIQRYKTEPRDVKRHSHFGGNLTFR